MRIGEIIERCAFIIHTPAPDPDVEVVKGYVSDLLSDVMGNAPEGSLWITLQIHANIVAVASLRNLAGIILVNKREPEKATLERASIENIPIFSTHLSAFDTAGQLYELGIRGDK
jgi:hypothetical protein